jgi:hypothetical protein
MSDNPTPTPAPAPNGGKTPKHHGLLDKHQLAEISKTSTIYGVVNGDPAILAQISDDQVITPAFMTTLGGDLDAMSQYTGGASAAVTDAIQETDAETGAKKLLLAKIHYIQSKAKIKYAANKGVLPEYGIGINIDISRPALETAADTIFNKLKTDTLPKITAQHSTDLKAASDAYKQTKVAQVDGKGDATVLRTKLADIVVSLAVRRRQLQQAADGEYPFTDPANAGMRRKFDLPPNRPLNP